jgi:hypothetical protein
VEAYESKVEADLAAMIARLGEDSEREAAGDEGEQGLGCVEEGFGLLVVALLNAHCEGLCCAGGAAGERGWYVQRVEGKMVLGRSGDVDVYCVYVHEGKCVHRE